MRDEAICMSGDTHDTSAGARALFLPSPGSQVVGRAALALLVALALVALALLAAPGRARAANGGAQVVFTAPIYAGQNNGDPEGPVDTMVAVAGSGWGAAATVALALADRANDTAGSPGTACNNGSGLIAIPGVTPVQVDSSGNFVFLFPWPASAGTQGHAYWICGAQAPNLSPPGVQAFTVLSATPPSLSVSAPEVTLGSQVTVTGKNWLPGSGPSFDQKVSVILAPCVACDPGGASLISATTVSAQADGTFSATLALPQAAKAGDKLFASAQSLGDGSQSLPPGTLTTGSSTNASFTVMAQATATPTATNTPAATATAPPTATSVANGGNAGNNTGNKAGANNLLIILLLALGGVLLLAAIVAIAMFLRSRTSVPVVPGGGGYPDGGGYGRPTGPPRRTHPDAPFTNQDYYGSPPPRPGRPGRPGGRQDNRPGRGPEDDDHFGDAPTIGTNTPWR